MALGQQKISFLSPIFHKAYSIVSTNGKVIESSNRISSMAMDFCLDWNTTRHRSNFYSMGFDLTFNKYYLLKINDYPKNFPNLNFGCGYWLDSDIYLKPDNTNNKFYYNLNNMMCVALFCRKRFQNIEISYELNLPVLGLYSGSEYSSSLPYFTKEDNSSFFSAFKVGSLGVNEQMANKISLDYEIKTKKRVRTFRFQYAVNSSLLTLNNNTKHNTFHVFKIGYLFNIVDYEHR